MIGQSILHYKITAKLGEGGMGVVYKAEDTKLKREVALKFLSRQSSLTQEEKARFEHEAQAAAALDHPNICTVFEINEFDGQAFLAMAFVDGQSLEMLIGESGGSLLAIEKVLEMGQQIAAGLQAAHEKGIVHRDIKPGNILVTEKGQVRITDFGLARQSGRTKLTKEGASVGTIAYMSPEQTLGEALDHRTDIWALGAVLYEMATGQKPFKGDYEQAVMYSILNEQPQPPTSLRSGMPMELERVILKSLARDPGERYQHADEMLVDLKNVASAPKSGTKAAAPAAPTGRSRRLLMAAGVAVILVATAVVYLVRDAPAIDSIAVLPFINANEDPEIEYLSDGITETLITKLTHLPQLRVMARSTVFRFKGTALTPQQVGDQLNVKAVLTGEIQQRGDAVLITAELVDVKDGAQIWGDRYDRNMSDIFAIQEAISEQISTRLSLRLNSEERNKLAKRYTEDSEAYQLYLKGRFHLAKRTGAGIQAALSYFQQAVERDPGYALAYAGLADCYMLLPVHSPLSTGEALAALKAAALQALQIDDQLAEAHTALAAGYSVLGWDWPAAEKSFVRALELNPNYATAHHWYGDAYLRFFGRLDEAIVEIKKALDLDPLSLIINTDLGQAYFYARKYELAEEQLLKTLLLDPDFFLANLILGFTYLFDGELAKTIETLKNTQRLNIHPAVFGALGYAYAISENAGDAQAMLREIEDPSKSTFSPYHSAKVYVGLKKPEKALALLWQAVEMHEIFLINVKIDPAWDSIRQHSRFVELLRLMRLDN